MGAQWKQAGRVENASKKGAIVGKLTKEILVASKMGGGSIENNSRLRAAVEAAKKASVPRDTIERAIKKGSGQLNDDENIESITYEGFAPHGVPVLIECLTNNRNRTASDIRTLFRKGQLGGVGSVAWMFHRVGIVEGSATGKNYDLESVAIESGAQDVETLETGGARFICNTSDLDSVNQALLSQGWTITLCELSYLPKTPMQLTPEAFKEVSDFLNDIDEHEDVRRVYAGLG